MSGATILSSALGVILGAAITWITAWYYAQKSAKDMERIIQEAVSQLNELIPQGAADRVVAKNLTNTVLAMMPFIVSGISKLASAHDEDGGSASDKTPPAAIPPTTPPMQDQNGR